MVWNYILIDGTKMLDSKTNMLIYVKPDPWVGKNSVLTFLEKLILEGSGGTRSQI
jgi:hypothetical protein